jgi:hypothetical protein
MVCPDAHSIQIPSFNLAGVANSMLNRLATLRVENYRFTFEGRDVVTMPIWVWLNVWRSVPIVKTIDGAASVAV